MKFFTGVFSGNLLILNLNLFSDILLLFSLGKQDDLWYSGA